MGLYWYRSAEGSREVLYRHCPSICWPCGKQKWRLRPLPLACKCLGAGGAQVPPKQEAADVAAWRRSATHSGVHWFQQCLLRTLAKMAFPCKRIASQSRIWVWSEAFRQTCPTETQFWLQRKRTRCCRSCRNGRTMTAMESLCFPPGATPGQQLFIPGLQWLCEQQVDELPGRALLHSLGMIQQAPYCAGSSP